MHFLWAFFLLVFPITGYANTDAPILNRVDLPLARSNIIPAIDALFAEADKNKNGIYDAAEQSIDTIAEIKKQMQTSTISMPACEKMGIIQPAESYTAILGAENFTPMLKESLYFLANQAFDKLDTNHDKNLTASEFSAYTTVNQNLTQTMNSQCEVFQNSVATGQLPDPKMIESIVGNLVALNKGFNGN